MRMLGRARETQGRKAVGPSSKFSRDYLAVHRLRQKQTGLTEGEPDHEVIENELRDPEGPLAQLLVDIGLRDPEWEFDVGDTP